MDNVKDAQKHRANKSTRKSTHKGMHKCTHKCTTSQHVSAIVARLVPKQQLETVPHAQQAVQAVSSFRKPTGSVAPLLSCLSSAKSPSALSAARLLATKYMHWDAACNLASQRTSAAQGPPPGGSKPAQRLYLVVEAAEAAHADGHPAGHERPRPGRGRRHPCGRTSTGQRQRKRRKRRHRRHIRLFGVFGRIWACLVR